MLKRLSKKLILPVLALLLGAFMCACVTFRAEVLPDKTIPPEPTPTLTPEPTAELTPEPMPEPVPTEEPVVIDVYDELGAYITGSEHYQRYISFENIQVYEQADDTFVDMRAVNSYPKALACALNMSFVDETGETVAKCRFQTQDGQYMLILKPVENVLYSQVPTDMRVTGLDFTIEYDESIGVMPDYSE